MAAAGTVEEVGVDAEDAACVNVCDASDNLENK